MKFRTDFVTNSSSSSFMVFNVRNSELYEYLQSLGVRMENANPGEFNEGMNLILPNGEDINIYDEEDVYPHVGDCTSTAAWIMAMFLYEVESVYPAKGADEYSDFALSFIRLLNEAGCLDLNFDKIEEWDRDDLLGQLSEFFDKMEKSTETASVEQNYGFEGDVECLEVVNLRNGRRTTIRYCDYDDMEPEDISEPQFVIAGSLEHFENRDELKDYIEELGGSVTSSISKNTSYLICNDFGSQSSKMKKAEELCIPVISEEAFIRRFGDPEEYGLETGDDLDLWDLTYEGEYASFFHETGIGNVIREVFKNSKWQLL